MMFIMCHPQLYLCLHVAQEMIQGTLGQFSGYISVNDGYTCKIKDIKELLRDLLQGCA